MKRMWNDMNGNIVLRLEDGRAVQFRAAEHPHFDYGYAVTSHSSQGLTADRVLINIDTNTHPQLLSSRFAYDAVSRARLEVEIYTDNSASLGQKLDQDITKTSAVDFAQSQAVTPRDSSLGQSI